MKILSFILTAIVSTVVFAQSTKSSEFEGRFSNDVILKLEDKTSSYSNYCTGQFNLGMSDSEVDYSFSIYDCGGKDYFADQSLLLAIIDQKLFLKDYDGNINLDSPVGQIREDGAAEFSIAKTERRVVSDEQEFLPNQCGSNPPAIDKEFVLRSQATIVLSKFDNAFYIERTSTAESIYVKRVKSQTCPGRTYFQKKLRTREQSIKGAALPL